MLTSRPLHPDGLPNLHQRRLLENLPSSFATAARCFVLERTDDGNATIGRSTAQRARQPESVESCGFSLSRRLDARETRHVISGFADIDWEPTEPSCWREGSQPCLRGPDRMAIASRVRRFPQRVRRHGEITHPPVEAQPLLCGVEDRPLNAGGQSRFGQASPHHQFGQPAAAVGARRR